ncbi:DUF7832 domain-containing protein [Leptospira weilii]|uniref:DUF7832 domain-containing protein n=1 Tax=Leptospira weilii TaxID=28184 RepID=UPI0003784369|nr:hypothetical protein [Leptospira weilii]
MYPPSSTVYDKAKWHYGGDYPEDLPDSQAFVHTGIYLGWLIENDLIDDAEPPFNEPEFKEAFQQFKAREVTPVTIYEELFDGCLSDDMLTDQGNKFTHFYYSGEYLDDYETFLADENIPTLYHVPFTWDAYSKISRVIDKRYKKWISNKNPRWWEFWK